jgi:hypothetical protein
MTFTGLDFRVAGHLKVVETSEAMAAVLQEAGIAKNRFRPVDSIFENESENSWLVKMQTITIAPHAF